MALETSSDQIDLKVSLAGYSLETVDKTTTNATAAARQENQFNIPVAPTDILLRQLSAQMASAAAAPPRGRGPDRVAAARTMLALGMSAESEALLGLAAADDPVVARDPNTAALMGVAAVLAGRSADAGGLDNPALPTGGDIALWRGLRDVNEGKPAPALAGAWPAYIRLSGSGAAANRSDRFWKLPLKTARTFRPEKWKGRRWPGAGAQACT